MKYYQKGESGIASDLNLDLPEITKEQFDALNAPTIQEQIEALENTITARNIRSAIQGDEYALAKIAQVEQQIQELRDQLGD